LLFCVHFISSFCRSDIVGGMKLKQRNKLKDIIVMRSFHFYIIDWKDEEKENFFTWHLICIYFKRRSTLYWYEFTWLCRYLCFFSESILLEWWCNNSREDRSASIHFFS
jgi:hypothetical protein